MAKVRTHYDNLKVARNAPLEVIRAAYKVLCQKHHPDRNNDNPDSTRIMKIINEAYEVLSDPIKREAHDQWIASQEKLHCGGSYDQQKAQEQAAQEEQARQEAQAREQAHQEAWAKEQAQWTETKEQVRQEQLKKSQRKKIFFSTIVIGGIVLFLIALWGEIQPWQKSAQTESYATPNIEADTQSAGVLSTEYPAENNISKYDEVESDVTYPTSFDCNKARSLTENLICHNSDLAMADRELEKLVKKARVNVSDQKTLSNRLRNQWNYREKNCKDETCLATWFAYQKNILSQMITTGDASIGLAKVELKPEALPSTGFKQGADFEGVAPLQIRVPFSGDHYFVKIEDVKTQQSLGGYFIRSGDTLNVDLPLGTYKIKYAFGKQWYGVDNLFGADTQYAKANEIFNFSFDGDQFNGYKIELIKQVNGNLKTSSIDKNQF